MTIINNLLTNSTASPIYTSMGNSAITTIHLCNFSNFTDVVNVYVVPSGFSANNYNIIYSNVTLTPGQTLIIYQEKLVLANGDTVRANANSANQVSATVSSLGI